jgi:hypothetical protein
VRTLLTVLGLLLLVLAGLNIRAPRFAPEWFGLAALAAAFMWPVLEALD